MDVLKPDILMIEGIRYRLNPGQYRSPGEAHNEKYEEEYYDQYDDTPNCEAFSDDEDDIEEIDGGRYKASFHIPKSYFSYIIGSKGVTRKRLETETRSKINIPKLGQDGDIVVTAPTKKNVSSARRRIRMMVLSSKRRRPITHFISIPLNKPSLKSGFLNFKAEVLEKFGNDRGITEIVFQSAERLHLTISVLVLSDEIERNDASKALQECKEDVISSILGSTKKIEIEMSGIEIFEDEHPSNAHILYGKTQISGNDTLLQELADGINTFFSKKGLLVREQKSVKLHCTLMNTKFYEKEEETVPESTTTIHNFDATNILENYKDYYFGKDLIETIELSIIGSSSQDEFYKATSFIKIP